MPPAKPISPDSPCPCGTNRTLQECCLGYIKGAQKAPTAEALMRSRYTAHCLLEIDYLWQTWHPSSRAGASKASIREWASGCDWQALEIISTTAGQAKDQEGQVEFIAHYTQQGVAHEHREHSLFRQSKSGWRYVDHIEE